MPTEEKNTHKHTQRTNSSGKVSYSVKNKIYYERGEELNSSLPGWKKKKKLKKETVR